MNNSNIGKIRIFQANKDALKDFATSGIDVIVGVGNEELEVISSSQDLANGWVKDNIVPFYPATNIKYIAVGNEVFKRKENVLYHVPSMKNIQAVLKIANL